MPSPAAPAADATAADAAPETRSEEAQAPARRTWPWVVLIVGLVLAFAAVTWVWIEGRRATSQLRQEVATRLAEGDSIAREARAAVRAGQDSIADLQQRLARAEAQLAETRGQQAAMEAVYQSVSRNREDRLLVEVEQAVGMAAQQLQLSGNVEAALAALRGAQSRLAESDAAPLIMLRSALANDIAALAVAPRLDVSGTALRIEVLLGSIDRMPLAFMAEPPALASVEAAPEQAGWLGRLKRLGLELWAELRSLVRVERLDRADPALLSPSQEVFLRENLRLRLLSARLALLSRDSRSFSADLDQAQAWIDRYFDTQTEIVKNVRTELGRLNELDLASDKLPALNDTYGALRTLQQRPPAYISAPLEEGPAKLAPKAKPEVEKPAAHNPPAAVPKPLAAKAVAGGDRNGTEKPGPSLQHKVDVPTAESPAPEAAGTPAAPAAAH